MRRSVRGSVRASLSALLVVATVVAAPVGARARAAAPEDAATLYEDGRKALENGEFSVAADRFEAAYQALPREELERRAAVLFELVEARISAFTEDGRPSHLCAATEILGDFLADNTEIRGSRRSRDARKAAELRETYSDELDLIRKDNPDFSCDDAELTPTTEEPPPAEDGVEPPAEVKQPSRGEPPTLLRLRDPLVGGGVGLISVGALLLGAAAAGLASGEHVEAEGTWLLGQRPDLPADAPEVGRLSEVGRRANLLAVIGGVTGAAALGTGIALFIVGKRRQRSTTPTVALTPSLSPRRLGAGLQMRF